MNVLQLSEDYYPKTAGGAFEDFHVSKEIASRNDSITVFTFRRSEYSTREFVDGIDIRRPVDLFFEDSEMGTPLNVVGRLMSLALLSLAVTKYLLQNDVDVVYSTNHLVHPLSSFLGTVFAIPVVSLVAYTPSLRESNKSITNPLYLLEQLNMKLFMGEFVHCRNPEIRDEIQRYNPESTVQVTHGILDTDVLGELQVRGGMPDNTTRIAFVGRLTQLKQPKKAVEVVSNLPSEYELVVVGDGPQREYVEGAAYHLQCGDRVSLLGMLPHKDTLEVLLESDILISTSLVESYPTVVFEALACSCDVVAPSIGILPHVESDIPNLHIVNRDAYANEVIGATGGGNEIDWDLAEELSIDKFSEEVHASLSNVATESI
jgi:glycosyltransferase involved in cell wall biosynthesis